MPLAILALTALRRPTLRVGRRLRAFHPGAGRADGHRRRRPQRPARPDRADVARPCRLLCHRRLYGRDPDPQGRRASGSRFRWRAWSRASSALLLALPALRVTGPYLAMVTIAFAFIVEHGTIEWRDLTGGQNGLMGIAPPIARRQRLRRARDGGARGLAARALRSMFFYRLAAQRLGQGAWSRCATREIAARSIGLNPVIVKTAAFAFSAVFDGLAGAIFAPLLMFVAPDSFPFSQSILFLLAVIVGGAGWVLGPVVGAVISVCLPGAAVEPRRIPAAVLRRAAAGGAVARAGGRARHARAASAPAIDPRRGRCDGFRSLRPSCSRQRARRDWRSRPRHRVRRHQGRDRRQLQRRARPDHQRHRAERRRQDHRAQHDRRLLSAGHRQRSGSATTSSPARRPGRSRAPASRAPTRPRSCSAR